MWKKHTKQQQQQKNLSSLKISRGYEETSHYSSLKMACFPVVVYIIKTITNKLNKLFVSGY